MRATTWQQLQDSRTLPAATLSVLAVAVAITLLQVAVPDVRLDLWRDHAALESGELWRVATPLLIQYDSPWNAISVLVVIVVVGTAVERVYGSARWLLIYAACGIAGQGFGYAWAPPDAASVAGAGLVGALSVWLLTPSSDAPLPPRLLAALAPLGGIALTVSKDMHGPPLLLGCALGILLRPTPGVGPYGKVG